MHLQRNKECSKRSKELEQICHRPKARESVSACRLDFDRALHRLAVIQSAKWKDRNGLWFGFGIIHYAAHNTPSPATAVLHTQSTCH
ncbi:hypothetical protein ANTQUA_LOCUS8937 [Anthophora quadrimaculata]